MRPAVPWATPVVLVIFLALVAVAVSALLSAAGVF